MERSSVGTTCSSSGNCTLTNNVQQSVAGVVNRGVWYAHRYDIAVRHAQVSHVVFFCNNPVSVARGLTPHELHKDIAFYAPPSRSSDSPNWRTSKRGPQLTGLLQPAVRQQHSCRIVCEPHASPSRVWTPQIARHTWPSLAPSFRYKLLGMGLELRRYDSARCEERDKRSCAQYMFLSLY